MTRIEFWECLCNTEYMPAQYKRGFVFILILVVLLAVGAAAAASLYLINKNSTKTPTSSETSDKFKIESIIKMVGFRDPNGNEKKVIVVWNKTLDEYPKVFLTSADLSKNGSFELNKVDAYTYWNSQNPIADKHFNISVSPSGRYIAFAFSLTESTEYALYDNNGNYIDMGSLIDEADRLAREKVVCGENDICLVSDPIWWDSDNDYFYFSVKYHGGVVSSQRDFIFKIHPDTKKIETYYP